MTNFVNAIERGVSAAVNAGTEQEEINEVIKLLASSVEVASGQAVTLELTQRSLKTSNDLLNSLAFVLTGTKYNALVLRRKNSTAEIVEIAKWGQDGKGYPVKIGIYSTEYFCPNREALERALIELVSTSDFGGAMRTAAKAAAKPAAKAAAKPAAKAAAKPAAKAAAKPAAKAAAKPAAKAAAKPAPKAR